MYWLLYDNGRHHERVKLIINSGKQKKPYKLTVAYISGACPNIIADTLVSP